VSSYSCVDDKVLFTLLSLAGTIAGGINKAGVDFYNSLINEVLAKGNPPPSVQHPWIEAKRNLKFL
jgi:hypothetical protein